MESRRTVDRADWRPRTGHRGRGIGVLLSALVSLAAATARGDVVTAWNETTYQIAGPLVTRTAAMVHVAVFDAVNSVDPRYEPYAFLEEVMAPTSPEAAAVGAAYGVLSRRFSTSPATLAALNEARATSLASIPDGPEKDAGLALGDLIAGKVIALRAGDRMLEPNPAYVPGSEPGEHQLTPPGFVAPVNVGAPDWVPFTMTRAAQFRPNGPPPLRSRGYARQIEEVQSLGAADSVLRTPEQTQIAQWHVEQGQFSLNRIARTEAVANGFDLLTNARLFALLNLALQDGVQSVFEAKYHYRFWRPVTAIPAADTDENPWTDADPTGFRCWCTPPHPEYPAAHAVVNASGYRGPEVRLRAPLRLHRHFGHGAGRDEKLRQLRRPAWRTRRSPGSTEASTSARPSKKGADQGKQLGRWILRHFLRRQRCD